MKISVLQVGELDGHKYTLERRDVYRRFYDHIVFVIVDFAGALYAFHSESAAKEHWKSMGIRALAQQEAA